MRWVDAAAIGACSALSILMAIIFIGFAGEVVHAVAIGAGLKTATATAITIIVVVPLIGAALGLLRESLR